MTTLADVNLALAGINTKRVPKSPVACCQSCSWAEIGNMNKDIKETDTIAFFHEQDAEHAFDHDTLENWRGEYGEGEEEYEEVEVDQNTNIENDLYIAWQGDRKRIHEILDMHRIKHDTPPDDSKRFVIHPN